MNRLGLTAVLILAFGIIAGAAATMFARASAGAFDSASISAGDTAWVLVSAALVMIMTPAVGFFYGGMVRTKSVVTLINESFVILAVVSVQWVLVGLFAEVAINSAGSNGLLFGNVDQLSIQVFVGLIVVAYSMAVTYVIVRRWTSSTGSASPKARKR